MNKRFKTWHMIQLAYSCLCIPAVRFAPWGLADSFRKEENAQGPCLWEEGALILHPKTKSLIYYRQCSTKSCPMWEAMQHPDAHFSRGMRHPWHQPFCLAHAVPSHSRIFRPFNTHTFTISLYFSTSPDRGITRAPHHSGTAPATCLRPVVQTLCFIYWLVFSLLPQVPAL